MKTETELLNLKDLVCELTETFTYFCGDNPPCPYFKVLGYPRTRLVVVAGDNASGKSLFGKVLRAYCSHYKQGEVIYSSMELRTGGGIERAFMYGSEASFSTGMNTVENILGAVGTSSNRDKSHLLLFDEPDIGLSESYQIAVGQYLNKYLKRKTQCRGMVVITHSKLLVQHLVAGKNTPHFVYFGKEGKNLKRWLEEEPKPVDLEYLHEQGIERFRAINKLMNRKGEK